MWGFGRLESARFVVGDHSYRVTLRGGKLVAEIGDAVGGVGLTPQAVPWTTWVERLSHDCILSEDTFQAINRPVAAERQRASGLRFADPRVHSLLHALILFRQVAQGLRAADLRRHLAALSGDDPASISQGVITYQLRRLRLHGLIERVPNSFRYRVTDFGFRVALFFTRTYNSLLRPTLAAALPALCAVTTPLKRAFTALDAQINTAINGLHLAAQT